MWYNEGQMILTYKIKHNRDFSRELELARKVAEFAIANRDKLSSKYASHIGLKSTIACQILRKYGRNKKVKTVKSVNLTIPNQGIQFKDRTIYISSLKLTMLFDRECEKINQIEIDDVYAYVSVSVREAIPYVPEVSIGVDLNTTSHCAVVAIKETGKVYKLGKEAYHIHRKYSRTRKFLQKKGLYKVVKKIKHRESNKVKNLNHRISRFIVDLAKKNRGGIHLEKLQGIRNQKCGRSFKYALNSWSFFQLNLFIGYKARLAGVPVFYHESAWTSQICSQCGLMGERKGKTFKCPTGHVEHVDVNAAFNHASPSESIVRLQAERDVCKRNSDIRREATLCV